MFLTIFAITLATGLAYYFYKYQTQWKYIEAFPGPKPWPIIGNILSFGSNPVENYTKIFKICKEYGPNIFRVWLGPYPGIILLKADDVEQILSRTTVLKKAFPYEFLHNWLGEGLLTSFGLKWFKHRKIITPSFHFKILKDFYEIMKKNSRKFVKKLTEISMNEKIFDIQNLIHYTTLDTICETAMGTQLNSLDDHNSDVVEAIQNMCYVIQRRPFNPFMLSNILYMFTKEYQIEKKAVGILKKFTMDVIEKRRLFLNKLQLMNGFTQNRNDDFNMGKSKRAFLDTLLLSKTDGQPLTTKDICDEVQTFVFEGHDTTTSGISFTIHLLSRNPSIQQKVFEEQINIFGKESIKYVEPSFQDIQNMPYLDMVIKESLRMYPSVPIIGRETTEPIYLNGKYVPPKTNFGVLIYIMGYLEENFPDPYKFDPERFSDRNVKNPFDYVPFSAGPRNCVGQKFATLEMKTVISEIIRNFEILPANDKYLSKDGYENFSSGKYDPVLSVALTLKSHNGIFIRLRDRIL